MTTPPDRAAGPGDGPDATAVDPASTEPVPGDEDSGEFVVPLGSPVGASELAELKRRAELPDPPDGCETPEQEDPEQSAR